MLLGLPHFPLGGLFPAVPAGLPSLAAIKAAGTGMDSNRNLLNPIFPGFPFPVSMASSSASSSSSMGGQGQTSPTSSMSDLVSFVTSNSNESKINGSSNQINIKSSKNYNSTKFPSCSSSNAKCLNCHQILPLENYHNIIFNTKVLKCSIFSI